MNSAGDNSDVAAYIASRTLRTHVMQFTVASPAWTCGLSALAVIGGYLPRRVNRDGLIAGLEIHGIKLANLVKPNDMPKVPADHESASASSVFARLTNVATPLGGISLKCGDHARQTLSTAQANHDRRD